MTTAADDGIWIVNRIRFQWERMREKYILYEYKYHRVLGSKKKEERGLYPSSALRCVRAECAFADYAFEWYLFRARFWICWLT